MAAQLDQTDRKLLNLLQAGFPLVSNPFAALAGELAIGEDEVLARARRLRESGVLRRLSAIFDVYRIGYKSSLIAMSMPPERLEEGAAVISAHPCVSHNYSRDHRLNLWFVLAIPRERDFEATVADMARRVGATRTLVLPALKLFKIDVRYDMVEGEGSSEPEERPKKGQRRKLAPAEIDAVRVLQQDLPITSHPFAAEARTLGLSEKALLARAAAFLEEGIMRRFAAVLRHQEAGFRANGMACWAVPEERIEEIGNILAASPRVSHCYQRPTYPDWPYPLYSMVHSPSRRQCESIVADLSRQTGVSDYTVLFSTKEYKKERVKYFVEEDYAGGAMSTRRRDRP
jgi:DNA-binding Lrp family transcriptional regulator